MPRTIPESTTGSIVVPVSPAASRRALIGAGSSLLLLAATAAGAAKAEELDGALLAACRDYHAARAEERRIAAEPWHPLNSLEELALDERQRVVGDRINAAIEQAAHLPARTPEGLAAKARLLRHALPRGAREFALSPESDEIRLALSLAADVLGRG